MPFRKCLDSSTFGAIQSLTTLCTERRLSQTRALLIYLIVIGTLIVLQDCTPILKRLEKVKFDPRFLEKLASFQGNKEYIDKKKKKKRCPSFKHSKGHANFS
jgi:hypothetical protein